MTKETRVLYYNECKVKILPIPADFSFPQKLEIIVSLDFIYSYQDLIKKPATHRFLDDNPQFAKALGSDMNLGIAFQNQINQNSDVSHEVNQSVFNDEFLIASLKVQAAINGFGFHKEPMIRPTKEITKNFHLTQEELPSAPRNISQNLISQFFKDPRDASAAKFNDKLSQLFSKTILNKNFGQTSLSDAQFIHKNDLLDDILENKTLQEALQKDDLLDEDLNQGFSQIAYQKLDQSFPLTNEYLSNNPDLSAFITLDVGNISQILNENPDLAYTLQLDSSYASELIKDDIAEYAGTLFDNNPEIDSELLRNHMGATAYLLENPTFVEKLNQDPELSTQFKNNIAVVDEQTSSSIQLKANELLKNRFLDADFFDMNPEMASIIVGSAHTHSDNPFHEFINENNSLLTNSRNPTLSTIDEKKLAFEYILQQNKDRFPQNTLMNDQFLRKNPGILFLSKISNDFQTELANDQSRLSSLFNGSEHLSQFTDLNSGFKALLLGYSSSTD